MPLTLTYRTTGAWGAGAGGDLTAAQVDTNFYTLAQAVQAISVTGSLISSITQPTPTTLLVTMADASTYGPFTLPVALWNAKGAWAPTTNYALYDVVFNGTKLYVVMVAHTSLSTFSAGYTIGGTLVYKEMFDLPVNSLPWAQNKQTGSTYTFTLSDVQTNVMNNYASGAATWTLNSLGFTVGDQIRIINMQNRRLNIVAGAGVTINLSASKLARLTRLGDEALLTYTATDTWYLSGPDLADALATVASASGTYSLDDTACRRREYDLGGNVTFNIAAPYDDTRDLEFFIKTRGTTADVVTFGTGFKSTGTLTVTTGTNQFYYVRFKSDGAGNLYEAARVGPMA